MASPLSIPKLIVCHNRRIKQQRVFAGLAERDKDSVDWFYGFKLHLIANDEGELLACRLTSGNVDDRRPVPQLAQDLFGKLIGDNGYRSKDLVAWLLEQGVELLTPIKRNMKPRLVRLNDQRLLRKRVLIETINDQLKNVSPIEPSRHRSPANFLVNVLAGLLAYCPQPKKPSLQVTPEILALISQ
jgi:Transposase DDE domain